MFEDVGVGDGGCVDGAGLFAVGAVEDDVAGFTVITLAGPVVAGEPVLAADGAFRRLPVPGDGEAVDDAVEEVADAALGGEADALEEVAGRVEGGGDDGAVAGADVVVVVVAQEGQAGEGRGEGG